MKEPGHNNPGFFHALITPAAGRGTGSGAGYSCRVYITRLSRNVRVYAGIIPAPGQGDGRPGSLSGAGRAPIGHIYRTTAAGIIPALSTHRDGSMEGQPGTLETAAGRALKIGAICPHTAPGGAVCVSIFPAGRKKQRGAFWLRFRATGAVDSLPAAGIKPRYMPKTARKGRCIAF